jgi:hypothetical protein
VKKESKEKKGKKKKKKKKKKRKKKRNVGMGKEGPNEAENSRDEDCRGKEEVHGIL